MVLKTHNVIVYIMIPCNLVITSTSESMANYAVRVGQIILWMFEQVDIL
jgi:hypothetical protein